MHVFDLVTDGLKPELVRRARRDVPLRAAARLGRAGRRARRVHRRAVGGARRGRLRSPRQHHLPDRGVLRRRGPPGRRRGRQPAGRPREQRRASAASTPTAGTTRRLPRRWRGPTRAWLERLITRRVPLEHLPGGLRHPGGRRQGRPRPSRERAASRTSRWSATCTPRRWSRPGAPSSGCACPRFDSPACFAALLDDDRAGHWTLAPEGAQECTGRRYLPGTLVLETTWQVPDGEVRVLDLMPPRDDRADLVRVVEGVRGRVAVRSTLRLRMDDGHVLPWVRHDARGLTAVAGPDAVRLDSPVPVHGDARQLGRDRHRRSRRARGVRPHLVVEPRARPAAARRGGGAAPHHRLLGGVVGPLPRDRPVPRAGAALAHHPEGADVRADRRDRRGPDDVAARGDRGFTQLGLPLLLAARRQRQPAGAAGRRLHRGGDRLARLAAASRGRRPVAAADHVRHRRPAPAAGDRAAVARRLRGLPPGPHRQRRRRAAAARRLGRGAGRPRAQPRRGRGARRRRLGPAGRAARAPRGCLAAARQRAVGDARCRAGSSPTQR